MSESIPRDRSKDFAKKIVVLCHEIKAAYHESVLKSRLLRSGAFVGADLHEAKRSPSAG